MKTILGPAINSKNDNAAGTSLLNDGIDLVGVYYARA